MHLCSHNLRIGVLYYENLVKVGPDNSLSGLVGRLYDKFFFSKSKR